MKIRIEELDKYRKLLSKLPYCPTIDKSVFFFPIETEYTKEQDGFELTVRTNDNSIRKALPGLTLKVDEDRVIVDLVYGDTTYSPKFDLIQYINLVDKASKKEIEELSNIDVFLVNKDYIFAQFKL